LRGFKDLGTAVGEGLHPCGVGGAVVEGLHYGSVGWKYGEQSGHGFRDMVSGTGSQEWAKRTWVVAEVSEGAVRSRT
jgi:hypothetical protein